MSKTIKSENKRQRTIRKYIFEIHTIKNTCFPNIYQERSYKLWKMSKEYKQLMEGEVQMVLKHIKKCSK